MHRRQLEALRGPPRARPGSGRGVGLATCSAVSCSGCISSPTLTFEARVPSPEPRIKLFMMLGREPCDVNDKGGDVLTDRREKRSALVRYDCVSDDDREGAAGVCWSSAPGDCGRAMEQRVFCTIAVDSIG